MKSHIYYSIDCKNSANSRIEWTVGNCSLSLIWVFRVPEVCFWLLSFLFFSLHLSSSHQEAQSSPGNCAVTARGNPGALLPCIPIKITAPVICSFWISSALLTWQTHLWTTLLLHSRNILMRAFWKAGCFSPRTAYWFCHARQVQSRVGRMPRHRSTPSLPVEI